MTGALFATYLAVWTMDWTGGAWPTHILWLDGLLVAAVLAVAWKRFRGALAPLALTCLHFVVQCRLLPAPRSMLEWGVASVLIGFGLLLLSLVVSYRMRNFDPSG